MLIKGARQMGKTSLLARGLQQARERGAKVVLTDFQKLNVSDLESPTNLYLTLAESMAEQLDLSVFAQDVWDERRGPNVNFERYLRREVLAKLNAPLVWGLDEVDRLFSCAFGSEVFGLFRSWHNERALDPNGPWAGMTLAIAYATEAHLFITDMNQSPFNVGTRLALDDFTFEQVTELNRRYRAPSKTRRRARALYQARQRPSVPGPARLARNDDGNIWISPLWKRKPTATKAFLATTSAACSCCWRATLC